MSHQVGHLKSSFSGLKGINPPLLGCYNPNTCSTMECQFQCAAGQYSDPGQAYCTDCEPGYYSGNDGAPFCLECPAGQYSTGGDDTCYPTDAGKTDL
jgi:hypothetical protein